jgi:dCTP deaminase
MSIKPDSWIEKMAIEHGMIEPFIPQQIKEGTVSYGLSSYGYDVIAANEFKIFTNVNTVVIDPKAFDANSFLEGTLQTDHNGSYIIVPPNSFVLARTVEYMRIPRDVVGLMTVKSTYARCGIVSPPTVLEPEWEGHITIEISNTTPLPARIYANEGIAQILFFQSDEPCRTSYADRKGKYQGQRGITLPKVKKN